MKCPYCGKKIDITSGFCTECGQNITNSVSTKNTDMYWSEVNKDDMQRVQEQKQFERQIASGRRIRANRRTILFVFVGIIIVTIVWGFLGYRSYSRNMVAEIKKNLVGQTFTAHDEHMEGLGWIHHEYWQLTFKDDSSLDYAYIETIGPKENDEKPIYEGTYGYTVSRSITGVYSIETNGATYELKVNNNMPTGISR